MSLTPSPASSQHPVLGAGGWAGAQEHWLKIESWARHGGSSSWALRNPPCSTAGLPLHEAASVLRTPHHSGSPRPDISLPGEIGRESPGERSCHCWNRDRPGTPTREVSASPPVASSGVEARGWRALRSGLSGTGSPASPSCPSPVAPCGLHLVLLASPSHSSGSCPPAVLLTFVSTVTTQQTELSQARATPWTSI